MDDLRVARFFSIEELETRDEKDRFNAGFGLFALEPAKRGAGPVPVSKRPQKKGLAGRTALTYKIIREIFEELIRFSIAPKIGFRQLYSGIPARCGLF